MEQVYACTRLCERNREKGRVGCVRKRRKKKGKKKEKKTKREERGVREDLRFSVRELRLFGDGIEAIH